MNMKKHCASKLPLKSKLFSTILCDILSSCSSSDLKPFAQNKQCPGCRLHTWRHQNIISVHTLQLTSFTQSSFQHCYSLCCQLKSRTKLHVLPWTNLEKKVVFFFFSTFIVDLTSWLIFINTDVNAYRLELEGITVKGKGCPKPIKTWVQCGVSMKILSAMKK